jgi:hypothetical protein
MRTILVDVSLALALLMPTTALAQGGSPTRPLSLSHPEDVIVTQAASGEELQGYLLELSPTTLAMLVNGKRVEMPIDNVLRIDGRRDSLKNGVAIGAAIVAGLGLFGCAERHGSRASCESGLALNAGAGALIGAGIDALHHGRTTIYRKPPGRR